MPRIVAHRGFHRSAHENTLRAFELAIASKIPWAELDVRRTHDGVLVVHHDPAIADAPIGLFSFNSLHTTAQRLGYSLDTLEDVLHLCRNQIKLDIELKEDGYESEVLALIQKFFEPSNFVITSFRPAAIAAVKQLSPQIRAGLLLDRDSDKQPAAPHLIDRIRHIRADFAAPHDQLVRSGFTEQLRPHAIPLWVWTVNDPARIAVHLADPAVEAIITDVPDLALAQRSDGL